MTQELKVGFTTMDEGTRADYDLVFAHDAENAAALADRVLGWMRSMDDASPYPVTRLGHSLQSATRAEADGADAETIVCALLHDVGDVLSPLNHSQVAAALLRPYVSDKNYWVVQHHGLFQGYYWFHHFDRDRNERDRYVGHEFYDECVRFCAEWDQNCFDPAYPTKPLEHFEPLVRSLLANPRESLV
jgi:predicted HD phosphohydrolase